MSDDRPSWVGAPAVAPTVATADPPERVPVALRVAVVVTAALVVVEVAHVAGRDDLVVGLRTFLVLVVVLQLVLAVLTARRNAGAALGLLVYQVTTVLAATAGGFGAVRGALAAGAFVVIVLVARSLSAFPTPELPRLDR